MERAKATACARNRLPRGGARAPLNARLGRSAEARRRTSDARAASLALVSEERSRVRLRQAVLVAAELEPVATALRGALDLGEPFRDPGVGAGRLLPRGDPADRAANSGGAAPRTPRRRRRLHGDLRCRGFGWGGLPRALGGGAR